MEIPEDKKQIIDGIVYYHISLFQYWDKNGKARIISEQNWQKLISDIKRNGLKNGFKIGEDFVVYDGNNRLKALRYWTEQNVLSSDNGRSLIWVPAEIKKIEKESDKWDIALSGNEQFASWDRDGLMNYLSEFENDLDIDLFNIDFFEHESISEQLAETSEEQGSGGNQKKDITCPNCGHQFTA